MSWTCVARSKPEGSTRAQESIRIVIRQVGIGDYGPLTRVAIEVVESKAIARPLQQLI